MYFGRNEHSNWNSCRNIIISEYKATISTTGFNFFDYSYVGIVITIISILFIALIGNKLIFLRNKISQNESLTDLKGYLFEVCLKIIAQQ